MNLLLAITICAGVDLYFLKDSPDLLVRFLPEIQTERVTLYYNFSDTGWGLMPVEKRGQFFDAILRTPDTLNILGIYFMYDNEDIDDNNGELYYYEVKIFPRMLMSCSIAEFEKMVDQAKKKIMSSTHIDEAITLLNYVDRVLTLMPVIKDSPNELKRNTLRIEVEELRSRIGK
ncbi:MAG: hypothetical protein E3J47_07670 [Candidatus Stahlbacteria bacterium]|nr:MAG: hypothetical protein E3J47_07670 [Candidatus Stahlbacteria bacterium]